MTVPNKAINVKVVFIFLTAAKTLLGLACCLNCIQLCRDIKLSSLHQQHSLSQGEFLCLLCEWFLSSALTITTFTLLVEVTLLMGPVFIYLFNKFQKLNFLLRFGFKVCFTSCDKRNIYPAQHNVKANPSKKIKFNKVSIKNSPFQVNEAIEVQTNIKLFINCYYQGKHPTLFKIAPNGSRSRLENLHNADRYSTVTTLILKYQILSLQVVLAHCYIFIVCFVDHSFLSCVFCFSPELSWWLHGFLNSRTALAVTSETIIGGKMLRTRYVTTSLL